MTVNLVRFKKDGKEVSFALPNGSTIIGRSSQCHIRIPILTVSKKHCQIDVDDGNVEINDLGSRNGTFLNKVPIIEPQTIKPGATLQIGPLIFLVQINGQPDLSKRSAAGGEKAPKATEKDTAKGRKEEIIKDQGELENKMAQSPAASKAGESGLDIDKDLEFLDDDLASFEEDMDAMGSNA